MYVVIMAGGRGTRIANLNSNVPKPMVPICGMPVLEHQMQVLKTQGLTDIILVIGYLGHIIQNYFDDGKKYGVSIKYIIEDKALGTAGALYYLKSMIQEDFLLINGDIIFDVDLARLISCHKTMGGLATILTHPNDHPYDSGIIITDNDGRVTDWLHKENKRLWYGNLVNAGLHVLSPKILKMGVFDNAQRLDLDRDILKPLIPDGKLFSYTSPEYVKDMGTPERFTEVEKDLKSGKVERRNLLNKQKAIFLDRDGTINRYVGFLKHIEEMELLPGVAEAVRKINRSEYLAILVTNQPVIARGEVTWEELRQIHNKLETLLGKEGAYLDAIYFCPHHPDSGYKGEVSELKIKCNCRKPNPGMLMHASLDYNIDLDASWMIGDSETDRMAGQAAGCRAVLLQGGNSLLKAVRLILGEE